MGFSRRLADPGGKGKLTRVDQLLQQRRIGVPPFPVTDSTLGSLNVPDPDASASFAIRHFGFTEEMAADGFVSVSRPDTGFNLIYLRTGLGSFKPAALRGRSADGLLIVLVVDEIDAEYARIQSEGVRITTPIETEPWGERYFQVTDPNGVVLQLVQWVEAPAND